MNLYPTADLKREMGETVLTLNLSVRQGMDWLELAAAQDAGRLDEYRAAVKAWEASKPLARDFTPDDVREALVAREALEREKAKAMLEELWSPLSS